MQDNYDYLFRVIVIGDSGVGKTNLLLRFATHTFQEDSKSTIGVQFFTKACRINNSNIKVQLWDTAGQERYKSISNSYYRGSHGAIICFDLTHQETLDNVLKWYSELKEHADQNVKVILVGNKVDLGQQRVIGSDTAQQMAKQIGAGYLETSALTSQNVDKAFEILIEQILIQQQQAQKAQSKTLNTNTTIILNKDQGKTSPKSQCCKA